MASVADIDKAGNESLVRWAATVRAAWGHMCEWEGVDPDSLFVTFSAENPIAPFYEIALRHFRETGMNRSAVGYEGLVIQNGRAVLDPTNKRKKPTTTTAKRKAK